MTLPHISIPFDTHKRRGKFNIPILSKEKFLNLARRVGDVSDQLFDKARSCMASGYLSLCLTLPRRCTLSKLLTFPEKGLQLVCEGNQLWLGFIPFYDSVSDLQQREPRGRKPFIHYRLGDFLRSLGKIVCKQNNVSLFSLLSVAQINQETQFQLSFIPNFSFLLLFDSLEKNGALVCCRGPLPFVSLYPILCLRQKEPNIQNVSSTRTGNIVIPFLIAKHIGFVCVPVWSLDHWNQEIKKRLIEDELVKDGGKFLMNDTFIFLPYGVSLDPIKGIKGINCAFVKNGPCLQIAFFPRKKTSKANCTQIKQNFSYFMETFSCESKNHYLPGNIFSFITLANDTYLVEQQNSSNLELRGCSFFFLASENGQTCSLLYKKGEFELKCTRPTDPEGRVFPIKRFLERSSAEKPPEKKSRKEEQGETSQVAMEEFKRVVEERRKEEAKMECADALLLLSQQQ